MLICALASGCTKVESRTKEHVNIYATETDAAYANVIAIPLTTLPQGEIVTVLGNTYGKDYWACQIRTHTGNEGWVLCTSLDYRGD
ncbi:SH3 domain-containing protein [Thiolinea disciformis]|uniref:SH3 domain-containing protein n=1 Tax=Thiolinea disciformis TaxID=125614 RepID=UPI003CCBE8A5